MCQVEKSAKSSSQWLYCALPTGFDEDLRHLHLLSLGNYMYQITKAIKVIQWPGQSVNNSEVAHTRKQKLFVDFICCVQFVERIF